MREFDRSLQRMRTDYVDVLLIHALVPSDEITVLETGVYRELRRLKEEGTARFIGFSSMDSAERSREAIEKLDFDVALLAMNPTGYGDFVTQALPAARARNVGVLAMKVMRDIVGESATPDELLRYALSQEGVASALIGHHGMSRLEENIGIVRALAAGAETGMASLESQHLESRLAHLAGPHALCWACPGYVDGEVERTV
jgi:predicted aldo/keto reductase-like oxidoreductase